MLKQSLFKDINININPMHMNTKNPRVPRPIGTTYLSQSLHKTSKETKEINNTNEITLEQLQIHIIEHYINNNYKYCNQTLSLESFSNYTNIPISLIQNTMYDKAKIQYGLLTKDGQEEIYGALFSMLSNWGLNDRIAALTHANTLVAEQNGQYVPYLSSEVTRALANAQSTTVNMINMARNFFGNQGSGFTINNVQNNLENATVTNNVLTTEKALQLIETKAPIKRLAEDKDTMDNLYQDYELSSMPELDARLQTGMDTSKEGLNFGKIADAILVDEGPNDPEHTHIDRRAESLDIDLESDNI